MTPAELSDITLGQLHELMNAMPKILKIMQGEGGNAASAPNWKLIGMTRAIGRARGIL